MATTKKKPSAAQVAARKLFAERARAGTLTKKTAKKRASESSTRHFRAGSGEEAAAAELRLAKKHAARRKNPSKRAARVETLTHRAKVAGAPVSTIYIVESSEDGKSWSFVQAYYSSHHAKASAEELAVVYPDSHIRVCSEKVK